MPARKRFDHHLLRRRLVFAPVWESAPILVMKPEQGCQTDSEAVRVHAVRLVCQDGWSTADAAKAVGCSQRSVQLWCRKSQNGKRPERLRTKKAPGARPKLTTVQKKKLIRMLEAGPVCAGFSSQLWTGPLVAKLVQREFGVTYHEIYLPALLRRWGFTPQQPQPRAVERDEQAITEWKERRWPALKKSPPEECQPGVSG